MPSLGARLPFCHLTTVLLAPVANAANPHVWDASALLEPVATVGADQCDFPRIRVNSSVRAALHSGRECAWPEDECMGLGPDWASKPWLFEGLTENRHLQGDAGPTGKAQMLRQFGHRQAVVSDSVAQSAGRKPITLAAYVGQEMRPWSNLSEALSAEAAHTWYLCNSNLWEELLLQYDRPPLLRGLAATLLAPGTSASLPITGSAGALSFGVGRSGSGLPFHFHGAQFVEVSQGQKRW